MGAVLDLPPSALPFGLQVGSRSVSLTDVRHAPPPGGAEVPPPGAATPSALSAVETGKRTGAFLVGREHLGALLVVLDAALAHPRVLASLSGSPAAPTAVAEGTPEGLRVTLGMLRVHGHAGGLGAWGPCSGVEILHVDLPGIRDTFATVPVPA